MSQAIDVQSKCVAQDGVGRARLLNLYWQGKRSADYMSTIQGLQTTDCPELDIEGAAIVLNSIYAGGAVPSARKDEEKILSCYLTASRPRQQIYELWAMYTLSKLYVSDENFGAAKAILESPVTPVASSSDRAQYYKERIKALLATIR